MHQPTLEEPGFPDGFDPAQAALEYLRAHNAAMWAMVLVIVFALLALVVGQPAQADRDAERSTFPLDDEPLDDEDHAAIAEARHGGSAYVPLETYFERRIDRAS